MTTRRAWRAWLAKHHATRSEVWLVYARVASGEPRIPYADAVEEALCYGWIDSVVRSLDERRFAQRFTPRRPGSNWSELNKRRARRLLAAGKMRAAGKRALGNALTSRKATVRLRPRVPGDLQTALERGRALAAFRSFAPSQRRHYLGWLEQAKKPATRARRVLEIVKQAKARAAKARAPRKRR